ncbi:MAG: phnA protein [Akkermansiaceae bacterium]|nr:phnA protein [Akkermansiaceae bacterium]
MAKGFDINQERKLALSSFGKDLARRAKSKCELTQAAGVPLVIYEIPPVPGVPDFDRCLLVSEAVLAQLEKPTTLRPEEWRHLSELIWSEIPAVQAMALRILRHLAPSEPWAQNLIEEAYLDPEVEAVADQVTL